jgi:hypothetical protein
MTGSIVTRTLEDGSKSYSAVYRTGVKQRWKTFRLRKQAERFLTATVKSIGDGAWREVRPLLVEEVIDRWLRFSVDVRQ